MGKNILDIFYNHIIYEASTGRIDCFSYFNILFFTKIIEDNIHIENKITDENLYIPTLTIKNKKEFNKYLVEYVLMAMEFYNDDNFNEEILNYELYNKDTKICKEKVILTLLWSNATIEDFNNPIEFLKRRIDFMKNNIEIQENIGYSEILQGNILVEIKKDDIRYETPFTFNVTLTNNNQKYQFPLLKFGIEDNKLYIYAIQRFDNQENDYSKKIKRKLYKIGDGFNKNEDNYEIYDDGNLNDVTASFVLVSNIAIFFLKKYGINEVIVPSILIERWNAKKIALKLRAQTKENPEEFIKQQLEKEDKIQKNITDKFIRTFLRLIHHHYSLNITSYPMEYDSYLHFKITAEEILCNNELLEETSVLALSNNKKNQI